MGHCLCHLVRAVIFLLMIPHFLKHHSWDQFS
jgi:hypothetical protein